MNKPSSPEHIGQVTPLVVNLLGLEAPIDNTIYIGASNRKHMADTHPEDYKKYGDFIADILSAPDYIGQNPKDNSIYCKRISLRWGVCKGCCPHFKYRPFLRSHSLCIK